MEVVGIGGVRGRQRQAITDVAAAGDGSRELMHRLSAKVAATPVDRGAIASPTNATDKSGSWEQHFEARECAMARDIGKLRRWVHELIGTAPDISESLLSSHWCTAESAPVEYNGAMQLRCRRDCAVGS